MLEQRIQQHFVDSADLKYQCAQVLGSQISDAVQAVVACVTNGCKVLCASDGGAGAQALADYAALCLTGQLERERPGLGAVALRTHSPNLSRQVDALGQAGDVLLLLCLEAQAQEVQAAVHSAHEREMMVVALTGRSAAPVLDVLLRETDVHISVPHDRGMRVHEVHMLVWHSICDGIDVHLLGE